MASWRTLPRYALRHRELWQMWQDPESIVGVRFGSHTRYALIDLDRSGLYHPHTDPNAIARLRQSLEEIGIVRSFLTRSSSSEGIHLWIPLPEAVATFGLAAALRMCLESQGFELKAGTLETFPNCKAYAPAGQFTQYQPHRLPLQPQTGAQLLDDQMQPILGGLERFFQFWDCCAAAQDIEQLRGSIKRAQVKYNQRAFRRRSTGSETWKKALESEIAEGWTGWGQTNDLLHSIATYGVVFEALEGEALTDYVVQTAQSCPGYAMWCRHQHEITRRAQSWAKAAADYYWALGTQPKRVGQFGQFGQLSADKRIDANMQRALAAQTRIQVAVAELIELNQLPDQISSREATIVAFAKCSKATLRKYLFLWHPQHFQKDSGIDACTEDAELETETYAPFDQEELKSTEPKPTEDVQATAHMKGGLLEAEAGRKKDLIGIGQVRESLVVGVNAATSSALTISSDSFKEEVDGYKPEPVVTDNTQTGIQVHKKADSLILSLNSLALTQPASIANVESELIDLTEPNFAPLWQQLNRSHPNDLTDFEKRMQQWLASNDPILSKEAERWLQSQPASSHPGEIL